ncbi:hypothetical protein KI387_000601 [Taxus chinensis]|uniref:PWWP domain-containing protein n=1 Tax=Taxus chinensis TaxID=29808 RepID=A0AA38GTL9_TAXCH|nr:hypothetical protein KI387_000601 [Taxus chinensis]
MVSLRNEVRKKRRAAENKLVQNSLGFCQETEKNNGSQLSRNDSSVRVSNGADNQGLTGKIDQARVCTKESARVCSDESVRVCSDESSRVCTNKNFRVSANKNDAVQLLTPKEEEFRVSTEVKSSAFKGLMKKAKMQTSFSVVDNDEDNVPIGMILLRSKKGDVLKKQHPCTQNYSDEEIPLHSATPVEYDVPRGGKDAKAEQEDKGQKENKLILQSDNDNSNVLLQKDMPSGGKYAKLMQEDKMQKRKQFNFLNADDSCDMPLQNMMPVKDDVPGRGKDVKVEQKDKGKKKKQVTLSNDNDNCDIPLQNMISVKDDVPGRGKNPKVGHKDKGQKRKQLSLSNDDDNFDVHLQNMMPVKDDIPGRGKDAKVERKEKNKHLILLNDDDNCDIPLLNMMPVKDDVPGRGKGAKVEQKDKGPKKKQHISPDYNDEDNVPSHNDVPVKDDVPCGGKDVKVQHQDGDQIKNQPVLENDNDDGDFASENSTPVKDNVPDICKDLKVEEKDMCCYLGRVSKFQEGDMVWAKVKSHPWWPGQVYNPIFAAPKARKLKPDHMLIAFFGDSSYGWFLESDLVPFEVNYAQKSKQTTQRGFVKAVEEAVDEISRRAALGLMCTCRNGDAFRPRRQEGYVNVDVQGYVTSGLYLAGQIEAAKNAFDPADMLSFVRCLAVSPGSGEVKCISGIKSVAEVLAYRVATFVSVNESYREALRIAESKGHSGTDACDRYELESEVVCRDCSAEPAPLDEQKEISKNVKLTNLERRSIMLGKVSDKNDSYMLKRREVVNRPSSVISDDSPLSYFIQADFLQTRPTNSEIKDEVDDTDCIGTYVFKKKFRNEEAVRKGERKEKKKSLLKEGDEFKEEQTRKKEVVRKALHMKPLDMEKESGISTASGKLSEAEEFNKGDIREAQAREKEVASKAFHTRLLETVEETQKAIFLRKTGQVEESNDLCNSAIGMSNDFSLIAESIQESNYLPLTNDLVGIHNAQVEGGQRLKKKPTDVKNIFDHNVSSVNMFEADEIKCRGSDKSSEGKQQMSPASMCADEIDHTGNVLQERSMFSGKESSDPSKLQDADSRDESNELQGMLTGFIDVNKESFLVNDVEHSNKVLITKTPKIEPAALERASSGGFHSRENLHNENFLACNRLRASEGQEIVHKAENNFENAGKSFLEVVPLSNNIIKPKILNSGGSENSFDESIPMVDNIQLDGGTERTSNQLPVSLVDVSIDLSEAGHNFTPSLELRGNLDRAAIKKTKGFKRLVKSEKFLGSKDTCDRRVKPVKRIRNNDKCLFSDLGPLEKRRKLSKAVESKSEALKDLTSSIDMLDSTALHYGTAALADDNQLLYPLLPDQCEGNEIQSKNTCSEDSRYGIRETLDDLLSLALNPFYGIERDCPLKISQVFLKFRSLVYQKSLTSISSLTSKKLPSVHEIKADTETKNKSGVKESCILLPFSKSKSLNVEDGVNYDSADLEQSGSAPQTSSKMEHSDSQILETGKIHAPEAKENKKRKLEMKSGSTSSLRRLKKLKDVDYRPSKKSDLRSSIKESSGVLRGDLHESVILTKVLKKSHFARSSNSSKSLEVPMALWMKFPPGFALPSEMQLKVRFARFGPLDVSGTRIYCNSGSAQVVFKHSSDAETAYTYATENCLFGQADVSFRLKQISQPKKEISISQSGSELARLSRVRNDEVPSLVSAMEHEDFSLWSSLDKHGIAEAVVECTPKSILQVQPVVQLKSCLKKPDDSGIDGGKETTRVTFLLGSEESSPTAQIAMEELSEIDNVNIPASISLPLEDNTIVNPPIENNAMESDPPNISHQMLYLLTKCNDIVTDIGRSLGYVPYCPL